jgi:hypothetical protein
VEYFAVFMYPLLKRVGQSDRLRNSPFQFLPPDWLDFFAQHGWDKRQVVYTSDVARRFRRSPPMPWWGRIVVRLTGNKARDRMRESTGYMLLAPRP